MTEQALESTTSEHDTRQAGLQAFQSVFRVASRKPPTKAPKPAQQRPVHTSQTRRTHRKSRAGCTNCKRRRIKCDEEHDSGCGQCHVHGVQCDFITTNSSALSEKTSYNTLNSEPECPGRPESAASDLNKIILYKTPGSKSPFLKSIPNRVTPYLQALQHFQQFTYSTVTSVEGQKIFSTSVLSIAQQADYLMHAILGTAAAHLACLCSSETSGLVRERHRRAEAYHWHQAVQRFRDVISRSDCLENTEMDGLISTCMLVGIHSLLDTEGSVVGSFVFQPIQSRAGALQWLTIQTGFRVVTGMFRGSLPTSIWSNVFNNVPTQESMNEPADCGDGKVHRDFLDLCQMQPGETRADNPYPPMLQGLFFLYELGEPSMHEFGQYMAFMGRLEGPFVGLLIQRDPAAMLILAHWLALVYQLEVWWIKDRAVKEIGAIASFLAGSSDERVRRLLMLPLETILR